MTVPDYDCNVNAITTGTETLTRPEGLERAACEAVAPGATLQEPTGLLETTITAGPVPWERPGPTARTTTAPRLEEPSSEIATLNTTTTTGAAPWTEPGTTIAATEVAPATETETKSTLTTKAPQGVERAYWSTLATEAPQGVERACETATTTTIRAPQGTERATTDEDPRQPDAGENNFEEDANSCVQEPTKNTLYESVLRYALSGYPENPVAGVEHIDFMPPRLEPKGDVTRTPENLAVTVKKTKETAPEEAVVGNADSASDTEEEPADMADSDRSREHRQPLENTQQGPARAALSTLNEDAESAHLERVGSVTDGTSEMVDNENDGEDLKTVAQDGQDKEGNLKAPPYKRLFTPEELDALADGRTLNAKEEKEEYDKELEERLPPLDEVELLKKRAQNAKKQKELTLEELSTLLKLPVETLERTRESSPGVLSTPEYWISWYRKTLAASEEARRANRDFRETAREREKPPPISSVTPGDSDGRDVGGGDDLIGDELLALPKERERSEPVNTNEKVVERNICVTFAVSDDDDPPVGGESSILPSRWRALVRSVVYRMVLEDEERGEPRCNACRKPATNMPTGECVPVQPVLLPEDEREPRARKLVIGAAGVLGDRVMAALIGQVLEGYEEEAPLMRAKRAERQQLCQCHRATSKVLSRRHRSRRGVHYDCTSLFCRGSEALGSSLSFPENGDDISHYVCSVRDPDGGVRLRKPGLVEVEDADEDDPVPAGKRVICSVGGVEAVSAGHFEDLPAELLIDSGAIASLVESRVLTRLGLKDAPLRTYQGSLNGVSGHKLRIKGEIDLPLRLGSLEKRRPFVVVDRLHVDAILGTDTLKAFRAVVDLDENTMTLKDTGEVFPLGAPRVEETYVSRIASTVRLCPGGQALVTSDIVGKAPESATVLIEGLPELDANVKIARTLCSIHGGKTIVEVCNASTEELVIKKGTALAVATVVPKSALALVEEKKEKKEKSSENPSDSSKSTSSTSTSSGLDSRWVDSVISSAAADSPNARDPMPGLKEAYEAELEPDFSDSKLDKEQQDLMKGLLDTFRDMFVETSLKPGRTHLLEFSIDTGTNPPIKQPPYRVSHAEGEVMESEIQQYLELGLIQPSTSPWASPVLMIRKPDGGIRFCIDYRRLNAVTVKDCYPMPLIDDILDVLKGAKLFSTMDIASGYWNVPMAAGSVEKTAFTCKYGLFEWLVMPFGLCNAVPAFERLMENVLVDLKWRTCLVYLDDCVVFSTDFPTHLVRLKQVLERFRAAGFKLKMKKCKWGRDQVAFLGHIITPSRILPNPEKVKAVMNVARPHDLHTVRAFLGLTSFFRRYIPGFAAISAPIERLKVKGVEFVWNDDCEAAFLQLKRRLVEPPILVYPDFSKRFKLYVDSSHLAVGACLMQTVEGRERVIAYASKLLVGSERNWIHKQNGTSEIECWGIVWATRKFRCYLDRNEFDLYTDHKALIWVFSEGNRTSNAKLARWAMELSQLRFKVYHKPGTAMGHVDGISRLHTQTICALSISDLLNDDSESPSDGFGAVGEGPASASPPRASPQRRAKSSRALDDALRAAKEALNAVGEPPAPQVPGGPLTDVAGDAGDEPDADGPEPDAAVEPDDEEFDYGDEVVSERPATSSVDIFGLDREHFVEEQKRTPWIQAVIAFLEYGALALDPQLRAKVLLISPHYVVRNGMLMRRVHLKARAGHARSIAVPVIPLPFVETVLHYCHADVFAAHVGQSKTMDKVRKHAYWHGWKRDVAEYMRACTVCGSGKGYRPWKNGLMQRMPVQELSGPFSLLVVDAIGPLVTTPRGNKYILVFADYFTRWVEAFPVEALDTITFVNIMIDEVLSRHGVPERLLSDRGTNFISDLAKSFYETLGIKKLFGAACHPQTQGLVERFNGTLIGMLRMFVSEAQSDWDLYLPRVLFAYRTSYHESLGDSPFFSLYGRDPVLPLDLAFLNTRNEWKSNEVAEYRRRLYLSLRDTRRMVERQLLKAQDRHARRLDDQVAVEFCEGDAVWVYQYFRARRGEKKTKKLAFSWHGPYRIVGKVGDNTYKVAIPNHPDRVVPVNVNRLKKFAGRWSRPFPNEVPAGVEHQPGADDAGPFTEDDLPSTSFVERLNLGGEETAFSGVTTPIVAIIGKRMKGRQEQYMVFTASYETCWRSTTSLLPEFAPLIKAYEDEQRSANGWPELRRSVRLADANATVDEDELLF